MLAMSEIHTNNVIALDGLDDAIIGTCSRGGEDAEVVAYDFNKVITLFENLGWTDEEIGEWLTELKDIIPPHSMPVFVYLDETVANDIRAQKGGIN